jgi:hypothetical protein
MLTMTQAAAFHFLFVCAILSLCQQNSGQHWTPNKPLSSCSWPIQLSGDHPIFSTTQWHTNNLATTTTAHQHSQKNMSARSLIFRLFPQCKSASFAVASKGLSQVPYVSIHRSNYVVTSLSLCSLVDESGDHKVTSTN